MSPPRGVEPYDSPTTVIVQRHEPSGASSVLISTDFYQSEQNRSVIMERVDSFQLRDKYMFATTTRVSCTAVLPRLPALLPATNITPVICGTMGCDVVPATRRLSVQILE